MLQFTTFPMHAESGLVTLRQVLEKLPANGLRWHVLDFEGIGTAPDNMTMETFEHAVHASPEGYSLSWDKLLVFAGSIEQTWNCLIVGCQPDAPIVAAHMRVQGFTGCRYVVQAFDSTEWSIGSSETADVQAGTTATY